MSSRRGTIRAEKAKRRTIFRAFKQRQYTSATYVNRSRYGDFGEFFGGALRVRKASLGVRRTFWTNSSNPDDTRHRRAGCLVQGDFTSSRVPRFQDNNIASKNKQNNNSQVNYLQTNTRIQPPSAKLGKVAYAQCGLVQWNKRSAPSWQ